MLTSTAWNSGNSRWEYAWDTSDCGNPSEVGITIDVSGDDPDCSNPTINAAQVTNITLDNTCSDLDPSTITIPNSQTVSGASVDLTTLFGTTGDVGGFTYTINGGAVTSPWDSTGFGNPAIEDVTFEVTGTDPDCGEVIVQSNTISVDNRPVDLTVGVASGVQSGLTSITVTMPYTGDRDGDARFQVDYKIASTVTWNVATLQDDVDNLSPYQEPLTGLEADETYDIRVTYDDPDGVSGTNPQTFQVVLVSWADDPLLHNALRFACDIDGYWTQASCEGATGNWSIDRKWTNGWGTNAAGDHYGPIMCSTCHVRGANNIKRIVSSVTSSSANSFPGSTVTFNDAIADNADVATNPADFGDDSDSRGATVSERICEVCHSVTQYHRATTNATPELTHYNKQDCIACHQHKQGFKASCAACHGNPPITDDTDGSTQTGLVHTPAPTGSADSGAHNKHVLDGTGPQYDCSYCHGSPFGSGASHTGDGSGAVTIDFNAFGSTAGTYFGQSTVTNGYDGGSNGASNNSLDCSNVYCHGGTIGGSTPAWSDASAPCGSCHGATVATPPAEPDASGTSHGTHAGNNTATGRTDIYQAGAIGLTCNNCHGAGFGGGTHVNGDVAFNVTALAQDPMAVSAVDYGGSGSGSSGGLAPSSPYQTCSNLLCHWGTETPIWNSDPATCTTCHSGATTGSSGAPDTGQHAEHVNANDDFVTCDNCHGTDSASGLHAGHIDGLLTFGNDMSAALHTEGATTRQAGDANYANDDSCLAACHQEADWGPNGAYDTITTFGEVTINWTGAGSCTPSDIKDVCIDCHSNKWAGASGPTIVTGWVGNGTGSPNGSHISATRTAGGSLEAMPGDNEASCTDLTNWKNQCLKCHPKHNNTHPTAGVEVVFIGNPGAWNTLDDASGTAYTAAQMRSRLGIDYTGTEHGGIYLGGSATASLNVTTEAELCWGCHDSLGSPASEWGFNTKTTPTGYPVVEIGLDDTIESSQESYSYGWIYSDAGHTTLTSNWVSGGPSGKNPLWKSVYQDELTMAITSVHTANVNTAGSSSVAANIDGSSDLVFDGATLETEGDIRCSYCHDVHETMGQTGKPWVRGNWVGSPYPPDLPPLTGYSWPTTGGPSGAGNRADNRIEEGQTTGTEVAMPRYYADKTGSTYPSRTKGGYFIDKNSGEPFLNGSMDTVDKTAGLCLLCHGTGASIADVVDDMDYYTGDSMWRTDMVNGHSNAVMEGGQSNARDIFSARRGSNYMANQDRVTAGQPCGSGCKSYPASNSNWPWVDTLGTNSSNSNKVRNIGWFESNNADIGTSTTGSDYTAWFYGASGTWSQDNTNGIGSGTGVTGERAHSFSCSKCHSPHAGYLPALLITNCLDRQIASWSANGGEVGPASGANNNSSEQQVNCHRKENNSTTTGWHRLNSGQLF